MNKMFINTFNIVNNKAAIEHKILQKNIYYKYLIIKNDIIFSEKNFEISLESSFLFQKAAVLPKSYFKKPILVGYSLNIKSYKFSSKNSSRCTFEMPFYGFNNNSLTTLSAKLLETRESVAIFLLSAVKGGFKVYSNTGILGFLPSGQLKRVIFSLSPGLKYLILSNFLKKKRHLFWVLAKIARLKIRQVFKLSKRKKKKIYSNFIFIHI
jgi:hypothetical protein